MSPAFDWLCSVHLRHTRILLAFALFQTLAHALTARPGITPRVCTLVLFILYWRHYLIFYTLVTGFIHSYMQLLLLPCIFVWLVVCLMVKCLTFQHLNIKHLCLYSFPGHEDVQSMLAFLQLCSLLQRKGTIDCYKLIYEEHQVHACVSHYVSYEIVL